MPIPVNTFPLRSFFYFLILTFYFVPGYHFNENVLQMHSVLLLSEIFGEKIKISG
jgi:hypothetical protein